MFLSRHMTNAWSTWDCQCNHFKAILAASLPKIISSWFKPATGLVRNKQRNRTNPDILPIDHWGSYTLRWMMALVEYHVCTFHARGANVISKTSKMLIRHFSFILLSYLCNHYLRSCFNNSLINQSNADLSFSALLSRWLLSKQTRCSRNYGIEGIRRGLRYN